MKRDIRKKIETFEKRHAGKKGCTLHASEIVTLLEISAPAGTAYERLAIEAAPQEIAYNSWRAGFAAGYERALRDARKAAAGSR